MAAYDSDIEDFEIDEETILDSEINMKFNEYNSEEIEVIPTKEFNVDELDYIDKHLTDSPLLHDAELPDIKFIDENTIAKVMSLSNDKYCENCGKKYKKEKFLDKHKILCEQVMSISSDASKQKSKTTVASERQLSVTNEQMHRQAVAIFEDTMKKISSDPIHSLNIGNYDSPGNKLKRLCDTLLSQERDNTKITDTVLEVFALFKDVNLVKEKDQEILWKLIHNYKVNERIIKEWDIYLQQYNDDSSSYLYLLDTFVMNIVNYVIEFENRQKCKNLPMTPKEVPLNDNEQHILRYVSGYIVFALKKKYNLLSKSSKSKEVAIAALQLLGTFMKCQISKVHNFLDFTHRWVEQVNRGGLVEVKDEFYLFIRSIENSVHKTLNISLIQRYEGEDLRDVLRNEILQNNLVEKYWQSLVHYLPSEQLANTLKLQIVEKWIDIRARSFVSCYVQLLKRRIASSKIKNVISTRTEPAMRKTLH